MISARIIINKLWGEREMKFVLVVSMIIIFYLGFIFIDKLCVLFDPIYFHASEKDTVFYSNQTMLCLIFGNNNISLDISKILDKSNISYTLINNLNELNNLDSYKYIFAVNKLDLENLMIYSLAKKAIDDFEFIAICNCSYNKKIFEDNHIPYLFGDNIQASQFVKSLLSSPRNYGGNYDVHI